MTANQNELLSALVDGELTGNELEQALQLLSTNEIARAQFQRHQLVSDVLHGHVLHNQSVNLTDRIADALRDEPALIILAKHKAKTFVIPFPAQFWKQATGLALAASVGALAVIGVMNQSQNQLMPASSNIIASVEQAPAAPIMVAGKGNRWTVSEPEVEDRLNTYLVNHNEYAGASSVFSYSRVVSYDAGR